MSFELELELQLKPELSLLKQSLSEPDQQLPNFNRGGCERSMLALGAEFTVDRPLKVGLELIRFLDRHRHIASKILVCRTTSPFRDVRRYRVCRASDLIGESAPPSCTEASEGGGFEGKHVGFLPHLEVSEIRHGENLSVSAASPSSFQCTSKR